MPFDRAVLHKHHCTPIDVALLSGETCLIGHLNYEISREVVMSRGLSWIIYLMSLVSLLACSSLPSSLQATVTPIGLHQARGQLAQYQGAPVRWGGTIVEVSNEARATWIQVLYYPLDRSGRPRLDGPNEGRFIVHSEQFLDPFVYKSGLELTVVGHLNGATPRQIGQAVLDLPIVEARNLHLWPTLPLYANDRFYSGFYGGYRYYRSGVFAAPYYMPWYGYWY